MVGGEEQADFLLGDDAGVDVGISGEIHERPRMVPRRAVLPLVVVCLVAWSAWRWNEQPGVPAADMHEVNSEEQEIAGAWNEQLVLDVLSKLNNVFLSPASAANQMLGSEMYECQKVDGKTVEDCASKTYAMSTLPDAPKFLRMGFHDCAKYKDGSGGCDGCLNLEHVFTKFDVTKKYQLHDEVKDRNNNLALSADVLERLYTDASFPRGSPKLEQSLQVSGRSRADLWALATLAAAHFGMSNNNNACKEKNAVLANEIGRPDLCALTPTTHMRFSSGRADCPASMKPALDNASSKFYRRRAYESLKAERLPGTHFSGKGVFEYFNRDFGFTAREAVAIMGAHSFGKFHADATLLKYDWTRAQRNLLNNEYYRIITLKKSFNKQSKPQFTVVGGPGRTTTNFSGALAETRWKVRAIKFTESGGPFQWSHEYKRCPFCIYNEKSGKWMVKEPGNGGSDYFRKEKCCTECTKEPGDPTIDPQCFDWISQDETAVAADVGLYLDFTSNSTTGRPLGCNFAKHAEQWKDGEVECPKQMLKTKKDGRKPRKMWRIADQYAEDQNVWVDDFIATLEKMLGNGASDLREDFSFEGVICSGGTSKVRCTKA